MRTLALAVCVSLLGIAGAANAAQVDVLWYDGTAGSGPQVPIYPYATGGKVSLGSDTLGSGLGTWDLVITGYSRTWDVTSATVGDTKQADLFLTFSSEGVSAYVFSLRYDAGGNNMLNVVALREYNVSVGSTAPSIDWGLGSVNPCEPYNNCGNGRLTGTPLDGLGNAYVATESSGGAGWLYRFSALTLGNGPATKNSTQVGTIRVGSVMFELNSTSGSTVVTLGEFRYPGALDSVVDNSSVITPAVIGAQAVVFPEPSSLALIGLALGGLGWARIRRS